MSAHAPHESRKHHENHAVPVITIDGPTASGKGTVAVLVAKKLGFHYLAAACCTVWWP